MRLANSRGNCVANRVKNHDEAYILQQKSGYKGTSLTISDFPIMQAICLKKLNNERLPNILRNQ
uniref:Uncharacterized protein n=1 Tax=Romanomermis culicivorax TaxID=13658 RepID=A0A915JKK8_ROMCU